MNKLIHIIKLGWSYKITHAISLSYPPFQYTIEPTNVCNLNCAFCPQSDPEHHLRRPGGKLTKDNFQIFLKRVKEANPGNDKINLTLDGEPFINKLMVRFVKMTSAAGYKAVFASNGTLLDRSTIDLLIEAGGFHVSIDFTADENIFETIRGQKGHYNVVKENLNYLIEKIRNNKKISLSINDIAPYTGTAPETSLENMRRLFDCPLPDRIHFTSRQFHNFCGHLPLNKTGKFYRLCPYPWTQLAVTYNGDCVACCRDTSVRTILGNIFEKPVMTIWNGKPYRQLRQNLLNHQPQLNAACQNCDLPYSGKEKRWKIKYMFHSLLER